jgi:hypothetical protein
VVVRLFGHRIKKNILQLLPQRKPYLGKGKNQKTNLTAEGAENAEKGSFLLKAKTYKLKPILPPAPLETFFVSNGAENAEVAEKG